MASASRSWRRVAVALALVAGLTGVGGSPSAAVGPTVTVTPASGLTDFQWVHVTATGFEPYDLLEWYQCRGGAVTDADCYGYNADMVDSDGAGNVDVWVLIDARFYLPDGTEVDCRTDPAGCEIGVGFMAEAGRWPAAALSFDPAAPLRPVVTATADRTTGLEDGDTVQVHAEHFSFREEAFAYLCAVGDEMPGTRCDIERWVRVVPDAEGSVDLDLTVYRRWVTGFGNTVDCDTAPDGCEIVVSWGFAIGVPDRIAQIPVSFAAPPAPTSTTTSTTTTEPAGPAAPPAVAVSGRPGYTG